MSNIAKTFVIILAFPKAMLSVFLLAGFHRLRIISSKSKSSVSFFSILVEARSSKLVFLSFCPIKMEITDGSGNFSLVISTRPIGRLFSFTFQLITELLLVNISLSIASNSMFVLFAYCFDLYFLSLFRLER